MNVLVTGAAGFIGSHVCEALLREGHQVTGFDNFDAFYDPARKETNLKDCRTSSAFKLIRGDLLNMDLLEGVFTQNQFELVVHLAARAGVRPSILDPMAYYRNNVDATVLLLEAMKRHRVRKLLLASSSSVYGNNTKVPYSEEDNVDRAISPYAATKKACEVLAHTYHHLYDLDVFCFRFFTVYGPRQRPEMAIHKFTQAIESGGPVTLYGEGKTSRDYTYISDIVTGIVQSVARVKGFEIINLGDSSAVSLIALVQLIEQAVGKTAKIVRVEEQPGDVASTCADIRKAKTILGYNPAVSIVEGIPLFVDWYFRTGRSSAETYR